MFLVGHKEVTFLLVVLAGIVVGCLELDRPIEE